MFMKAEKVKFDKRQWFHTVKTRQDDKLGEVVINVGEGGGIEKISVPLISQTTKSTWVFCHGNHFIR